MRLLLDVSISSKLVEPLTQLGHEVEAWASIGADNAPDHVILEHAASNDRIIVTHDLDFGTLLAASGARTPSVIQFRTEDVRPLAMVPLVQRALEQFRAELAEGALIVVHEHRTKAAILPLKSK